MLLRNHELTGTEIVFSRDGDEEDEVWAGLGAGGRVGDPGGGVAGAVRVRRGGARNEGRRGGGALSACVGISENSLSLGAFLNANLSFIL